MELLGPVKAVAMVAKAPHAPPRGVHLITAATPSHNMPLDFIWDHTMVESWVVPNGQTTGDPAPCYANIAQQDLWIKSHSEHFRALPDLSHQALESSG